MVVLFVVLLCSSSSMVAVGLEHGVGWHMSWAGHGLEWSPRQTGGLLIGKETEMII